MDLTGLQVELRSIEDRISALRAEIEKMKPNPEDEKGVAYENITKLARKHPITNAMLNAEPEEQQKMYIQCLSYLALANGVNTTAKLLYLSRITAGGRLNLSAEDIYALALSFDADDLAKICIELEKLKHLLLTDAMIILNLSTEATLQEYALVADMAKLMNCEQSDIRVIAQVAKAVLTNDFNILKPLPLPLDNRWSGKFKSHIPEEWIISQRVLCRKICVEEYELIPTIRNLMMARRSTLGIATSSRQNELTYQPHYPAVVKKIVKNNSLVKYGDRILLYEARDEKIMVDAPQDGVAFILNDSVKNTSTGHDDKYVVAYVASIFDVYEDFCAWYKKENNQGA